MLPLCKHIFLMQKILVRHQGTNALCELGMQEKLILYEDVNPLNHGSVHVLFYKNIKFYQMLLYY